MSTNSYLGSTKIAVPKRTKNGQDGDFQSAYIASTFDLEIMFISEMLIQLMCSKDQDTEGTKFI